MRKNNYSGKQQFQYSVLRYRNPETNELVIYDNSEETWGEVELELEITATAYYDEGSSYGEPEDCYPSESDFEIQDIFDKTGTIKSESQLTSNELEDICIETIERIKEDAQGYDEDYSSYSDGDYNYSRVPDDVYL
jgi:hypothetical protein